MKKPRRLTLCVTFLAAVICILGWHASRPSVAQEQPSPKSPAAAPGPSPAAAGPAGTAVAAPADAQAKHAAALSQLRKSRNLLSKQTSIRARIVETISIFDQSVKAEGRYLQGNLKANDRLLRLELKMKVGETEGSLLEVCDGQVLWTRHGIGKETPTETRRNVTQILDAASKHGGIPAHVLIADLGLGGVPALLASLERVMRFNGIRQETLRNHPVDVIQGTWNDLMLKRWQLPAQPDKPAPPLPVFIPDLARIYLDRDSGFPHRILYLKRIPGKETLRPLLTLDFFDVALNQPIDKTEFDYIPPSGSKVQDLTPIYLQQLQPPETVVAPGTVPGGVPGAPPAAKP